MNTTTAKHLGATGIKALTELQNIMYQERPLIDLVIKNFMERKLTNEQISGVLYELHCTDKVQLSEDAINYPRFDILIIAHYEQLHENRQQL